MTLGTGTKKVKCCNLAIVEGHVTGIGDRLAVASLILEVICSAKSYKDVCDSYTDAREALDAIAACSNEMRMALRELKKG